MTIHFGLQEHSGRVISRNVHSVFIAQGKSQLAYVPDIFPRRIAEHGFSNCFGCWNAAMASPHASVIVLADQ